MNSVTSSVTFLNCEPKYIEQYVHGEAHLISFESKNVMNNVQILLLVYSVVIYC